jgi:hypothetical protein
MTCLTPCADVAKRNADISITIPKEGYEAQVVQLTKDIPATGPVGFAGNLLLGGVVGMDVDAVTVLRPTTCQIPSSSRCSRWLLRQHHAGSQGRQRPPEPERDRGSPLSSLLRTRLFTRQAGRLICLNLPFG